MEKCFALVKGDEETLELAGGLTSTSSCIFERTCAYAQWALKSRVLSVCMSLYQNSLEKKSYLFDYLVYWYHGECAHKSLDLGSNGS